jgi:2-polyprenyl-6-hydroxyphenyl methylase/3-demethylubiquinone-9 3-methyltransferase
VLAPGGTLVVDTLARTALARFLAITVAERVPGGAPPGIHDPALLVDRDELVRECARHGVRLRLIGLRPTVRACLALLAGRRSPARAMTPTRVTGVLFQAVGTNEIPR